MLFNPPLLAFPILTPSKSKASCFIFLQRMITLLFTIVGAEMVLILGMLFRNPLRSLLINGLDHAKQGSGQVVTKTLALTMLVLFISTLYGAIGINERLAEGGNVNPTDEVLMAQQTLHASLMGFSLFLALVMDRIHYYLKELYVQRNGQRLRMATRFRPTQYEKERDPDESE